MKRVEFFIAIVLTLALSACVKSALAPPSQYKIPNCDFESWTADDELKEWKTNSCPACVPAFNTYIVQKTSEAYHGQYAAKFLYNGVYSAAASAKFAVTGHPVELTGYVKCQLYANDTAFIKVRVFKANIVVDSGIWKSTELINKYTVFSLPITQSTATADSVSISIRGGQRTTDGGSSTLWVDYLSL